jgi:hypothetical protein
MNHIEMKMSLIQIPLFFAYSELQVTQLSLLLMTPLVSPLNPNFTPFTPTITVAIHMPSENAPPMFMLPHQLKWLSMVVGT